MGRSIVLLLALPCACGRMQFDQHDTALAPENRTLACGQQRFQVGLALSGMTATATHDGVAMFGVDAAGELRGWTYSIGKGTLTATQENVALGDNANGALGVATVGATTLVAVSNGKPVATGTTLYSFGHDLSQLATPHATSDLVSSAPITTDGAAFVYATQLANKEVDVRFVNADGTNASAPVLIAPSTLAAGNVSIIRGGSAYAMTYAKAGGASSDVILLDVATLAPVIGPKRIDSNPTYQAYRPMIAYASTSQTYLVTWFTKDVTGDDDVWAELYDASLVPIGQPFEVAQYSSSAGVSTDGTDFWMSYRTYSKNGAPDVLAATHVTSSGAMTPYTIAGSGGTPGHWWLLERAGQSVLVWTEINGSGPDLYIGPLCN